MRRDGGLTIEVEMVDKDKKKMGVKKKSQEYLHKKLRGTEVLKSFPNGSSSPTQYPVAY